MLIRYVVVNSVKSETLVKWSCQWIYEFVNFCVWTKINRATFSSCFYIEPSKSMILSWYFYLYPCHLYGSYNIGSYYTGTIWYSSQWDYQKVKMMTQSLNFLRISIKKSLRHHVFVVRRTKIEQCSTFDYRLG